MRIYAFSLLPAFPVVGASRPAIPGPFYVLPAWTNTRIPGVRMPHISTCGVLGLDEPGSFLRSRFAEPAREPFDLCLFLGLGSR